MILSVANPIYDSVFKFLMEDERIAKTVLTALLKKEVVSVEMRRHEHANTTRNDISMFRIDFAAKVKEANGEIKLILIELQKTWLETETLRFRQYLAVQYNAQENMEKNDKGKSYAIPMIAVYLLGHRVGKIEQPVVYVNHGAVDYDGKVVTEGNTDPFINSLIHDSIIVQIPLLHGKINNRLDKVLSVFDQKQCDSHNRQVVNLDEKNYEGDDDMMYILRRLSAATVNADLRQEMSVEDEYFSAIEERDTALMERDKRIAQQDSTIAEQSSKIAEQDSKLAEQASLLRTMAKMLYDNGNTTSTIAQALNKSEEEVKALLGI